jgi:hypothetical protein
MTPFIQGLSPRVVQRQVVRGIAKWHPAIEKCVLSADGKLRTLSLKGGSTIAKSPRSATTQRSPAPSPLSRGRCR